MKNIILAGITILLMACNATQNTQIAVKKAYFDKTITQEKDMNITEKWQVVPQTKINFKKDQFGVGMVGLSKGDNTVFYYKYDAQPVDKSIMDGGYVQEIYFEIPDDIKNMSLKDADLSKINLLVGKHGFFRGSGVYPVVAGSFDLKVLGSDQFEVDIHITKPADMVRKTQIHQIISLNQNDDE